MLFRLLLNLHNAIFAFILYPARLFDHLNYTLTDNQEIINMYRAADHRRAELVSGGRLFDLGQVPKTVWRYVQ